MRAQHYILLYMYLQFNINREAREEKKNGSNNQQQKYNPTCDIFIFTSINILYVYV